VVDFNHYYRTGSSESEQRSALKACSKPHCVAPKLIAWPTVPGDEAHCVRDVNIGLIDTGINAEHATFKAGQVEVINAVEEGQKASSRQHGTAVAAILVGSRDSRTPGLLPDAKLIAVDAFYRTAGKDELSDVYTLVTAMDILAAKQVSVINLSLAGPPNDLLEDMTRRLVDREIVLVAAAGNAGPRAKPAFPSAYPGVISVTAIDRSKRIYRRAGRGSHIDLAAPGVGVWTAASIRGARTKTGTSFATPFVTAAAVFKQKRLGSTKPDLIAEALAKNALDLGAPGRDDIYGHGLVQVAGSCALPTLPDPSPHP